MFWLKEVVPIRQKNTFWTHDVKAYREAKAHNPRMSTTKSEIEAIEKGIQASIALNERVMKSLEPLSTDEVGSRRDAYASTRVVDDLRGDLHRAYATNALESALFVGNVDATGQGPQYLRRRRPTRNEKMLPQDLFCIEEDDNDNLANERGSLLRTASRIPGGLAEVGSVLFSPSLEQARDSVSNDSYRPSQQPSLSHFWNVFSSRR